MQVQASFIDTCIYLAQRFPLAECLYSNTWHPWFTPSTPTTAANNRLNDRIVPCGRPRAARAERDRLADPYNYKSMTLPLRPPPSRSGTNKLPRRVQSFFSSGHLSKISPSCRIEVETGTARIPPPPRVVPASGEGGVRGGTDLNIKDQTSTLIASGDGHVCVAIVGSDRRTVGAKEANSRTSSPSPSSTRGTWLEMHCGPGPSRRMSRRPSDSGDMLIRPLRADRNSPPQRAMGMDSPCSAESRR